jgi:Helix-turn-helix domain
LLSHDDYARPWETAGVKRHSKPEPATSNAKLADKSQPHGDRQFLTNSQLQEILPLSRRSIFEWRRKGILPSIQVGAKILYHRESVIAALLRQQHGGME